MAFYSLMSHDIGIICINNVPLMAQPRPVSLSQYKPFLGDRLVYSNSVLFQNFGISCLRCIDSLSILIKLTLSIIESSTVAYSSSKPLMFPVKSSSDEWIPSLTGAILTLERSTLFSSRNEINSLKFSSVGR